MPFINLTKIVNEAQRMREEFNDEEFEELFLSIRAMYHIQLEKGYKTRYGWLKVTKLEG